jgi:hypothetical protein
MSLSAYMLKILVKQSLYIKAMDTRVLMLQTKLYHNHGNLRRHSQTENIS